MQDQFIKKYWEEENTLFYLHFHNARAVRQIELTPVKKVYLSSEQPDADDTTLYDQSIDDLDPDQKDFISASEFEKIWENGRAGEVQIKERVPKTGL
ncbi:hypothetical protein LZZ85_17775 [Terrimonas sp. NA20]|uniref:EF-hand domain-containing protein n=1 Tax=Terrimonas ginsenosidimutans TaxID=2908004 RepID=A0ABS9KV04_9BACT|nr:hypothetical protein [Terrimonas ginsenosidimutans]MCG2616151.1 hypothetical protein [Terrimonas ginsenosidimutans]